MLKRHFLLLPIVTLLLFLTSCKKEEAKTITITITETVTVTDTVTVTETVTESVAIVMKPIEQDYFSSLGYYGSVKLDYSVTNLGDKKIDWIDITFEATTKDGSKYNVTGMIWDIEAGETISDLAYGTVAEKECTSLKVKKVEITIY